MNTREVLEELKYNTGTLPHRALREAVATKEQITPALLKIVEDAKLLPDILHEDRYMAHIYAMYLLAQFREKRAYPPIVEFFSIPGEITLDCTGDVVTEDLHRILASVSHGDTSLIKPLAENNDANEYVRSAALESLLTQMVCGEATRDEVMAYYQRLLRGGLPREPAHIWDSLVSCCTDLYPGEVMEDIVEAYRDGLVSEGYIDFQFVTEALARGKEKVLRELHEDRKRRLVEDVVRDMEWWACFHPEGRRATVLRHPIAPGGIGPLTLVRKQETGRNEPCPCGSGKKFKRCCGR